MTYIGAVAGTVTLLGDVTGYSSGKDGESQVLTQDNQPLADAMGSNGTKITVNASTTKEDFKLLRFTDDDPAGPWVWVADGKWPAIGIDIGNIGRNSKSSKHPIDPQRYGYKRSR